MAADLRQVATPSTLDSALTYAARGWAVLPVRAGSKIPLTARGVQDASTDDGVIREWWARWPSARVAIAAGAVSRLAVLDADPRHTGDKSLIAVEQQHGALPSTLKAKTPGGGHHYYFVLRNGQAVRNSASKIAPGLDIRGDGGYVVAPPSPGYIWMREIEPVPLPDWLATLISGPPQNFGPSPERDASPKIREGDRNATLTSLGGTMRRPGMTFEAISAALLEENRRRCDPPLPEAEVRKIAASVARYRPAPARSSGANNRSLSSFARPWPEQLAREAFYGFAGEVVRTIEPTTEADPAALLVQFLVAFGNVIGRGPHFLVEQHPHYTNLFAVIVGITAKSRKGTSWARIADLFGTVDPGWHANRIHGGIGSGEGLIWAVRDPILKGEKLVDEGLSDKRLLLLETEFAHPLAIAAREGNTVSETLRRAWDGTPLQTLTKNSPARATGAHISVLGHITRTELFRHLGVTEVANGFANRFLFVCARRSKSLPEGGALDSHQIAALVERLRGAVEFAQQVETMKRDDRARSLWAEVYAELSEGKPGLFGAVISRAEAQVLRLSMLYALLDLSAEIRLEHLAAALVIWEYCESSALHIFGDALGDPVADEILRALRAGPDGLTRTEIRNLFGRHRSEGEIGRALSLLVEHDLAAWRGEQTGGRPVERWFAGTLWRDKSDQSDKTDRAAGDMSLWSHMSHRKE